MSGKPPDGEGEKAGQADPGHAQRVDLWLFHARVFRQRGLAADRVTAGAVRLTRHGQTRRLEKPGANVMVGDVLAIAMGRGLVKVLKVVALPEARASARQARAAYLDLSPLADPSTGPFDRQDALSLQDALSVQDAALREHALDSRPDAD